ncbi:glycosyltransferase [Nemorincola caseinilytica]|uniref:Glycosyltransferase n=1 Tax=Nemorincola caseinilytica TaxID=2054315 RepID=A0ABP8NK77_9BACT
MKILFLANRVPYPPYRGDKLKIYNLAKRLCSRHELHLLTFAQTEDDLSYTAELEKLFKKVHIIYLPKWRSILNCVSGLWSDVPLQLLYFHSAELQQKLNEMISEHRYDAVHVQHLRMSPYLAARKDIPRILDLPDAFSLYWERRKNVKRSLAVTLFENMEQKRVLKYEKVLKDYDMSLVCSAEDLEYLEHHHHTGNLRLLPNGVDMTTFSPRHHDYAQNDTLLFTGNMDYEPNVDAVIYFTHSVLPLIRRKHPHVKLIIAGQRPVPKVQELANDHVQVTGFVKDLADTYNAASVVVAPLRFGAGTQNKVLEAMAMGIPVVCSNIGFAGLGIKSGEGAIMQTDTAAFADTVIQLLSSEEMRRKTGQAGAEVIRTRFDWDIIAGTLERYLQEVAARK